MAAWCWLQSAADRLQTNDQVLSLTDQMNLGVRLVELDTHWVKVPVVIHWSLACHYLRTLSPCTLFSP